jgi:rod shape-determining protein MreC
VAVAVIAQITPDGGMARIVAEPAGANFVSVMPVYAADAVAQIEDPETTTSRTPSEADSGARTGQ